MDYRKQAVAGQTIAEVVAVAGEVTWVPVTFDACDHVEGPYFHGTKFALPIGERLVVGQPSNFEDGRRSNNVYFTALLEVAVLGAELATALSGRDGDRPHVYVVEPTGPFEDDPNVTNKRFPGNPTRSYRTPHPMVVTDEVHDWQAHPPEVLKARLDGLARLREQGLAVIED